jgi:phenylacetate-CoA ligase
VTDPATGMPTRSTLLQRLLNTSFLALHYRGQAKYPYKPLEQILADQSRRVRRTVAYAYRHVPYYRETMGRLGLYPAGFVTAGDLEKLPLIERAQVQRDPEYFVSTAEPLDHYLRIRNSGTTGQPCTFYCDSRALLLDAAHTGRAYAVLKPLLDKPVGYRKTMIFPAGGAARRVQAFLREHTLLPGAVALRRQTVSVYDPPETNVLLINEFRPDVVHSFGSYLAALFEHVQSARTPVHLPRAVLYTGDALPETALRLIQDELHVPVFGIYEAIEAHNIGFECEQRSGLHLNDDLCALRIVDADGRTLPDGESGSVVISNLVSRATVLLNYRLDDIATRLPGSCACGRSLPLLSSVEGRSDDWLEVPSGHLVHPQAVVKIFKNVQGLWQWQVVQETPTCFCVHLVTAEACDRQAARQEIEAEFVRVFGEGTTVDIRFVNTVQRTAGGKVRSVVSRRAQTDKNAAAVSAGRALPRRQSSDPHL